MQLPVEIEYHILQDIVGVDMLTWSHFVKIICIIPTCNMTSQQIKMIKSGSCVMNEVNVLGNCQISCLHQCLPKICA